MGIHAGESHRGQVDDCERYTYARPLVDWEWDQADCEAAIVRAGLPVPHKSACWFCPAMKKHEVIRLAKDEPGLFARAVAMERNAKPNLGSVKGLGRNWTWEGIVKADASQLRMFVDTIDTPCMCDDG